MRRLSSVSGGVGVVGAHPSYFISIATPLASLEVGSSSSVQSLGCGSNTQCSSNGSINCSVGRVRGASLGGSQFAESAGKGRSLLRPRPWSVCATATATHCHAMHVGYRHASTSGRGHAGGARGASAASDSDSAAGGGEGGGGDGGAGAEGGKAKSGSRAQNFNSPDPHKVLGISKSASVELVREAYLGLCKEHHPDVGGCDANFKRINWAYEECKLYCKTGGGAGAEYGDADDAGGADDDGEGSGRRRYTAAEQERRSEARRAWQQAKQDRDWADLREEFREQFEVAEDPQLIDELLEEALMSGCFSQQDISEPLMMALQRYHLGMGFGAAHAQKCFEAMDNWERLAGRPLHMMFFHTLLTLYSNQAFAHASDSMTVSETVNTIMDRMAEKGLPHDDWTIMIANRVFRAVPYPDW